MKKIVSVLLAAAAIVACSKDKAAVDSPLAAAPSDVKTITVSIPETLTKVDFAAGADLDAGLTLSWAAGDQIRIISGSESVVYDIQPGFEGHTASFSGPAISGTSYTVIYPAAFESEDAAKDISAFANQAQSANGATDGLKYVAVLRNVDSYEDIQFNDEWAEAHGGSFRQNGVIRIREQFPAEVQTISDAVLLVSVGGTPTGRIILTFTSGADLSPDHVLTAYAAIPVGDLDIPENASIDLLFATTDYDVYSRTLDLGALSLRSGKVNTFNLDKSKLSLQPFYGGAGTEADPYLIGNVRQMKNLPGALTAGAITSFRLISDLDMTGVEWESVNAPSPFNKGVSLDGGNHTISNLSCKSSSYPGLFGVLYGSVKDLTLDGANIDGTASSSANSGVLAGYIGTGNYGATVSGVTVRNSTVNTKSYAGGLGGRCGATTTITDCHVINTTVTTSGERVGGILGQLDNKDGSSVTSCTAESVTLSATKNVGGIVGVNYKDVSNCSASGTISSPNTTKDVDIALGGIVGYLEGGTVSNCSSSVNIAQTTNGRDIGGVVGKMLAGTVKQCFATGTISGIQRNVGGLVGVISLTSGTATVTDCYCTGNVTANSYIGGLIGYIETGTVTISNCYAAGETITATSFNAGGLIGMEGTASVSVSKSAAWSKTVTASSIGSGNWSTGAVIGVCFPTSTVTDCYRNPSMSLSAYWVPAADYQHPNVSASTPLVKQDGTQSAATAIKSGQDGYPQFPYHGKVEAGKTLSRLASTTLGWSSDIWDFSGDRPTLKANPES